MTQAVRRAEKTRRSPILHVLGALLLTQGASALFGGGALILDPSGAALGLPLDLLQGTPFGDYLVPGLILASVLGLLPCAAAAALYRGLSSARSTRQGARSGGRSWWLGAVASGAGLIVWIVVQIGIIGFVGAIQVFALALGCAVVAVALQPSVRREAGVGGAAIPLVAIAAAAAGGALLGVAMPRGPVTSGQALAALAVAVAVGIVAGSTARSRWTYVSAPATLLLAFELVRMGASGPTVDAPRFDSAYGILAFVLGRLILVLVVVVPSLLAVAAARTPTRARATRSPVGIARAGLVVLGALLVAGLAVVVARPGTTPPLVGSDGAPVPDGIAVLDRVRLGGGDQGIMIRGHDVDAPVLLYLSGGPGQSDLPYARVLFGDLERDFIVVGWDQRGTGTSYPALDPVSTHTLDGAVNDTIQLAEYLRDRFDEEAVYLLGESWGTTLGVLAAQRRPDLFHAFIGSGQMVSQSLTDRRIWRDLLAHAEGTGNWDLYDRVLSLGEPPYRDVPWSNSFVMAHYGLLTPPYDPPAAYVRRGSEAGLGPWGVLGSEYGLVDKVNVLRGLVDAFAALYPQLQELDLRRDVPRLEVPVYLLDGEAELAARRDLALAWYEDLDAPIKRLYTFADGGHSVAFEQFDELGRILTETIVPETYGR